MKRIKPLSLLLTFVFVFCVFSAFPFAVGATNTDPYTNIGEGLTGVYNPDNNTLTITGESGQPCKMTDFQTEEQTPWYEHRDTLTTIILEGEVISIGENAFRGFTVLNSVTLNSCLKTIGGYSFMGCTSLKSISLNSDLSKIGICSFLNCTSLETISGLDSISDIQGGAFGNTKWIANNKKPSGLVIVNNTVIDGQSCSGTVTIDSGVTKISTYAFQGAKITSVNVPSTVKTIGERAFEYCSSLSTVTLNDGVQVINTLAFSECTALKSLSLPKSLTTIGEKAFGYNGLTKQEDFTAYVYDSSKAQTYCNTNGINFVTVDKVSSISIQSKPKDEYCIGEEFDSSGLVVYANYSAGGGATLSLDACEISGYDMQKTGKQTVTVKYQTFEASFEITVKNISLTSIKIKSNPSKLEYFIGEEFDNSGLVVVKVFSNNEEQELNPSEYKLSGYNMQSTGTQTVTITYGSFSTSFKITVKDITALSISIKSNPSKTEYFIGDNFSSDGLEVLATYNNGTTKTLSLNSCTLSGYNMLSAGIQTVRVKYGDLLTSFNITVKDITVSGIGIVSNPSKTEYFVGDNFSSDGLAVSATYNNGTTKTLSLNSCTLSGYNMLSAGSQTVWIKYSDFSTSFGITVKKLSTPKVKTAKSPKKNRAVITWQSVGGAKGYNIYRKIKNNGKWKKIGRVSGQGKTSFTDKKAPKGKKCFYSVQAFNGNAVGTYNKAGKGVKIKGKTKR